MRVNIAIFIMLIMVNILMFHRLVEVLLPQLDSNGALIWLLSFLCSAILAFPIVLALDRSMKKEKQRIASGGPIGYIPRDGIKILIVFFTMVTAPVIYINVYDLLPGWDIQEMMGLLSCYVAAAVFSWLLITMLNRSIMNQSRTKLD